MNTTTVLVEHLLSGVQAFIWLVLLTMSIFGYDWIHPESFMSFEAFLSFGSLAIIYPLGVFMDNLSDTILSKRVKKIRSIYIKNEKLGVGDILDKTSGPLTEYFTYTRMRIRISRITFFNFILITITLVIFTFLRLQNIAGDSLAFILFWEIITGLFISFFAFWNWDVITNKYYNKAAKEIIKFGMDTDG